MNAIPETDRAASNIAAAIGEPARARMLFSLSDGRARTGTELAIVAEVSPSTASVHLARLKTEGLVHMVVQGKHRYYRLAGPAVARVLEDLSVLAGAKRRPFVPNTPDGLRTARTCYDHIAGSLGVAIHDGLLRLGWLATERGTPKGAYSLSDEGLIRITSLGIDVDEAAAARRKFAYPCLDWSERKFHLGGSLAAAFLNCAHRKKWVLQEADSRALTLSRSGQEVLRRIGIQV